MKKNLIILSCFIVFWSCEKEVDELPPATQIGANTFGARVKGKLWIPQGFGIAPTAPLLEASYSGDNTIIINARNFSASPNDTEIEILLKQVTKP
ncbi:MAG: hypothetical protein ABR503_06485, partial [Chitinophagaceae bacterium]